MTDRLYYHDSFLYDFDARVVESAEREGKYAIVLDRTAFYAHQRRKVHDTGTFLLDSKGWRSLSGRPRKDGRIVLSLRAIGVEQRSRRIEHVRGVTICSSTPAAVLSPHAFGFSILPTVSFHMGEESCTIDLETSLLSRRTGAKARCWPMNHAETGPSQSVCFTRQARS